MINCLKHYCVGPTAAVIRFWNSCSRVRERGFGLHLGVPDLTNRSIFHKSHALPCVLHGIGGEMGWLQRFLCFFILSFEKILQEFHSTFNSTNPPVGPTYVQAHSWQQGYLVLEWGTLWASLLILVAKKILIFLAYQWAEKLIDNTFLSFERCPCHDRKLKEIRTPFSYAEEFCPSILTVHSIICRRIFTFSCLKIFTVLFNKIFLSTYF